MTQPKNSEHKLSIETAQSRPELRKLLRKKRLDMTADQKLALDTEIGRQLLAWSRQNKPASVGVYWPIQAEPDLRPHYQELQENGVHLALPLVVARDKALSFMDWQMGDVMAVDSYGIAIPAHGRLVNQPEVLIIPCLGWNQAGYRLGYGGGFYDRTLAVSPRPLAIGIAYACTQAEFTSEPHDIAMDFIITA